MIVTGIEGNTITPVQTNLLPVRRLNFMTGEPLSKGWRPTTPFHVAPSRPSTTRAEIGDGSALMGAGEFFSATTEEPKSATTSQ